MVIGRGGSPSPAEIDTEKPATTTSRKQEKLRKRQEKGDTRVKMQNVRK